MALARNFVAVVAVVIRIGNKIDYGRFKPGIFTKEKECGEQLYLLKIPSTVLLFYHMVKFLI